MSLGGHPNIEDSGREGSLFVRGCLIIDRQSDAGEFIDAIRWSQLFNDRRRDASESLSPATACADQVLHTEPLAQPESHDHA